MKKEFLNEVHLVDLGDEQLKELLGFTYHALKNLDERRKNDEHIEKLRSELKQYIDETYRDETKKLKAQLKAGRSLAAARGIKWKLPAIK